MLIIIRSENVRGHIQRKDVWEAAPRNFLLFLGTFDWQFSGQPRASGAKLDYLLYLPPRHLSSPPFLPRKLFVPFSSSFLRSPLCPPRQYTRSHKDDVPRIHALTITASHAFIARLGYGWHAYHRHLVSYD